jgi:hypothetical protein
MTATDTRTPIWRRRWAQATGAFLALALIGGAAAGGATLAGSRTTVIRPAANTAPAQPNKTAAPAPSHKAAKPRQAPAPAAVGAAPVSYARHILAAGITAPVPWINKTGQQLADYWRQGYTAAWTDANVLTPGDIYAYHLATFDQITARDFGVTPPAQGIQPAAPAAPAPAAPAPAPAPHLTNASAVVAQFYQDISDKDFQAAWVLGGDNLNGGVGYSAWAAGYATTASVDLGTYGTWSDGTVWANITATQTDGTVKTYYGTYTVSDGVIVSAHITQTS